MSTTQTESIDSSLNDLDLQSNEQVLEHLLQSQERAVAAVRQAKSMLDSAVSAASLRLSTGQGRLVLAGAGASGRLAVQDGAELWPTFGWPHERLLLKMAGGSAALLASIEDVEDDSSGAIDDVKQNAINSNDVVVAVAASGESAWTCSWLEQARLQGALTIGMANNQRTRLLNGADCPVWLDTGAEVLAGSTRMAAGTAQKIALNTFSTTLMIRLNRTYGNLMVDMAAVNKKLDRRRIRLLQGVLPHLNDGEAQMAIDAAQGWVKLAALLASGDDVAQGKERLVAHQGSLRDALSARCAENTG